MAREGEHADRDFKDRFWEKLNHVARKYPETSIKLVSEPAQDPNPIGVSEVEEEDDEPQPQVKAPKQDQTSPQKLPQPISHPAIQPKNRVVSTSKRCQVLQCLSDFGGLRQSDIAKKTGIVVTTLYNLVDDMRDNGLVSKVGRSEPGKVRPTTYIEITAKGKTELENITQANASNSD